MASTMQRREMYAMEHREAYAKERRGMYAKIAIARKQLPDMDEEAYRQLLEHEYGTRHASGLNRHQLAGLVQTLAKMGATYTSKGSNKQVRPHSRPDWIEITDSMEYAPEKRQILAIWRKLGYSMNSLDTRVKRAFGVPLLVWMKDREQLSTLLSDLQRRERTFDRKKAGGAGERA